MLQKPSQQTMTFDLTARLLKRLWPIAALYCCASLVHFIHNAEYLAFYPNMPAWIGRDTVYLAWLVVTLPGVLAMLCLSLGWRVTGLVLLMAYGATGFDGLGHYALALCSQHTFAQNFTIWFEVVTGAVLMMSSGWQAWCDA